MEKVERKLKLGLPQNWIFGIWAIVLLAPLIYFPAPGILAGHPWKVELLISLILVSAIVAFYFFSSTDQLKFSVSPKICLWVIAPLGVFCLWSGISLFWANSTESVIHHSLMWAVYLIFFLFAARIANKKRFLKISLLALSLTVAATAIQCIVEHTFSAQIDENFGFRFSRYAEIYAALMPLFLSFVLRMNRKHLWWSGFLISIIWTAILFSLSRGSFLSAVFGLAVFAVLRFLTKIDFREKKRFAFAAAGLILIALAVQFFPFSFSSQTPTALTRLTTQDSNNAGNNIEQNVRLLFIGVGLEMFEKNLLTGVGADNFGLEFNKYRKSFSAAEKNKSVAGLQEESIPERAHNEYLQILAELGVVGGFIFLFFVAGVFKLSFAQLKETKNSRNNILIHAALAGIIAFLLSSLVSSFSFRLMQNGIVFFFLLALLLKNYFSVQAVSAINFYNISRLKIIPVCAVLLCLGLVTLSVLKATSQFFVYRAEQTLDFDNACEYFETAAKLDPANASANYLFGLRLLSEKNYREASEQLKIGIDKGLNSSPSYSLLATTQILSGDTQSAEQTLENAVEIFPYSAFMRVRYAAILKTNGENSASEREFQIAKKINSPQASTWWTFINNGAAVANEISFTDKNVVSVNDLYPSQAIPLILTERGLLHPEEATKFNFNN